FDGYSYGLYGTPTTRSLETRIAEIEGARRSILVPSGLAALTHPLLALLKSGDSVLMADCVYGPTRNFALRNLAPNGIEVSFVAANAASIAEQLRPNTRLVVLESPGSLTMEIQDISVICKEAHAVDALVMVDNTWGFGASQLFQHGVDIVSTALSKYAGGHSDVCMGSMSVADESLYRKLKSFATGLGTGVSSDDAYLVLRGTETLELRLAEHARRGLLISTWLAEQPQVLQVRNPALPGDEYHSRFRKYFNSGNGLISVLLKESRLERLSAMLDGYRHFRIGASWGGTHSLVALADLRPARTVAPLNHDAFIVRFHIGLEPIAALFEDLKQGLERLAQPTLQAAC
ncbi:MAG: PLP-dependent transferase, partial [Rhodoferax sp.]